MRTVVTAKRLWTSAGIVDDPVLEIEDGCISRISTATASCAASTYSFGDALIAPPFFDVHFHGAAGHDVMEATPEALTAIGTFLARHGTANYLATTVTAPIDATLHALSQLAKIINSPASLPVTAARPIGIHLEGPFLSHSRRGVQPAEHLRTPDVRTFDQFFEASAGLIRVMTIAPELPNAIDLIEHANALGVRVSLGHSDADTASAQAGINAGAVSATHTFNAMRPLDHRNPGILGAVLTDDRLYAELICDGVHVHPEMVRLWWRAKGDERSILITDAMSATGMPDGKYQLGGFDVEVANGRAMKDGVLAGSVLTQDRALSNFVAFTEVPIEKALRLLTTNPSAMTGSRVPALVEGERADFVVVERTGALTASFIAGQLICG